MQSSDVGVTIAMSLKVLDDNFGVGEEKKRWLEARADLIVRTAGYRWYGYPVTGEGISQKSWKGLELKVH